MDCYERLRRKLLRLAGSDVILPETEEEDPDWEPHCTELLRRGRLREPDQVLSLSLFASQCHVNSSIIWALRGIRSIPKNAHIATGWALTDDTWRQHTWVQIGRGSNFAIIETTSVERERYFGLVLTTAEAGVFAEEQLLQEADDG